MTYVFLSYAKADRDAALAMRDVLRREGLSSVWMDENLHELNNEHWPTIESNILSAAAFVLLLSDAAKESAWVKRELDYAEKIQKPIFSILIQGEAWERLKEEPLRPSLGASLDLPDEFAALVKTLDAPYANLPEQIPADRVSPPKSPLKPKNLIIAAIVLAIAILFIRLSLYYIGMRVDDENFSMTLTAPFAQSTVIALNQQNTQAAERRLTHEARETLQASSTATDSAVVMATFEFSLEQIEATLTAYISRMPCGASAIENDSESFSLYSLPSFEAQVLRTFPIYGETVRLSVTAIMTNNEGRWYYVGVENTSYRGYVPAESLSLDEDCPR